MKTSDFTAIQRRLENITGINKQIVYLKECTGFQFVTSQSQIRIEYTSNTAVYTAMANLLEELYIERKNKEIEALKAYGVEYDGE